jgi:hypothetical protein
MGRAETVDTENVAHGIPVWVVVLAEYIPKVVDSCPGVHRVAEETCLVVHSDLVRCFVEHIVPAELAASFALLVADMP